MVQLYDLMVLTVPQAAAEGKETFKEKIDALITKQKGKILSCDEWGERGLAYPVAKYDRGMYYVYAVEIDSAAAVVLHTKLQTEKGMLRHLMVKRPVVKA